MSIFLRKFSSLGTRDEGRGAAQGPVAVDRGQWSDGYRNNSGPRAAVDSGQKRVTDTENKTASVSVSLPLGEGGPRSGG